MPPKRDAYILPHARPPQVWGFHTGAAVPYTALCEGADFARNHAPPAIDFATSHLWCALLPCRPPALPPLACATVRVELQGCKQAPGTPPACWALAVPRDGSRTMASQLCPSADNCPPAGPVPGAPPPAHAPL